MRITIDAAGRIVVPKSVRDALGLGARHIERDVPPVEMRLEDRGGLVVAVPDKPLPTLTAGRVREVLEQTRR